MLYKISAFIFLTIFSLNACGQNRSASPSAGNENRPVSNQESKATETPKELKENECKICDFDFAGYKGDLKEEEIGGLLLALNDEYHAWSTYDGVNKDFDNPRPFSNIQQSEAQHIERLKQVFKTYNVPFPENKWIGNAPKFQSVGEACKAGVDAEIVNRDLYEKIFETTKREDILMVYRALQRASEENHLPAFERCGGGRGNR